MRIYKHSFLLCLILLICSNIKVSAQEFELTMSCPDTIGTDQQLKVSFKVFTNEKEFELKSKTSFVVKGGEVMSGPNQSISTSYQVLNGKVVESRSISYNYVVLSNYTPNDIIIDPMEFDVMRNNDVVTHLKTDQKIVKVIKGYKLSDEEDKEDNTESISKSTTETKKVQSSKDIDPNDVIFKWTTDKTEINLGDTVLCNCDLYTLLQPTQLLKNTKLVDDCIILEDTINEMTLKHVEYEGKQYYQVHVQSFKIIPLRTGVFSIGGNTFELELFGVDDSVDPLDAFFNNVPPNYIHYEAKSNKISVNVKGKVSQGENTVTPGNDCFILCDISTSMTVDDIEPSRKSCVQEFANKWIEKFPETGIVSFAGKVEQYYPSNQNLGAITFLDEPKVDGTAIGDAMIAPISCDARVKDIIIITDGMNNKGYLSLNTAFSIINKFNVRVSYIYLNSCNDSINYVPKGFDEPTRVENDKVSESELKSIKKMVQLTGGFFGKAKDKNELFGFLPELLRLAKTENRKSSGKQVYDDKILRRFLNQYKEEVLMNTVNKE